MDELHGVNCSRQMWVERQQQLLISFHYQYDGGVRYLLKKNQGALDGAQYHQQVTFNIILPADAVSSFLIQLGEMTGGSASVGKSL
ncbi:MAG: DUF1949 domain-containing protein [Desulforhopalus sp.]